MRITRKNAHIRSYGLGNEGDLIGRGGENYWAYQRGCPVISFTLQAVFREVPTLVLVAELDGLNGREREYCQQRHNQRKWREEFSVVEGKPHIYVGGR